MIQPGIIHVHRALNVTFPFEKYWQNDAIPWWSILLAVLPSLFWLWLSSWPAEKIKLHPRKASPFAHDLEIPRNIDTIVIGSGVGGCACANILAQSGQKVLMLEQHFRTGGCTHSFRGQGCEWDTGLHYTSKAMSQKTCRAGAIMHFMSQGLQEWTVLEDTYDEILFPKDENVMSGLPNKSSYCFVSGGQETINSILNNIDPNNPLLKKRMSNYIKVCTRINQGFTALGLSRILPSWLHFCLRKRIHSLHKFASMTVRDVQYAVLNLGYTPERLLQEACPQAPPGTEPDPTIRRLKAVLTHPVGDYAVQPRDATMAAHGVTMAHYRDGAAYTVGPTQNISIRLSSMVREFGGEVLVSATIRGIIVEHGRAIGVRVCCTPALEQCKTEEERAAIPTKEIRAKNIVWASGIYNLYSKVLPQDLPQVKDFQDQSKRTVSQSNGHLFLFCKLKGSPEELNLPKHNLWYFNGYDVDQAFDKYFANPRDTRPPTCYIGFPCTKDVTWKERFPGVSNCILISDGLWEWFEKWQNRPVHFRGTDYEEFKNQLSMHLLSILYDTVPQVKDKVEFYELGTPLSEVTYLSSFHGGSYGTKCTTSMFDEINRKWTTTPHTDIKNLYLAGSDAFLPAVCGSMYGGLFGACAILGQVGTLRLTWAFLGDLATSIKKENPKLSWVGAYRLAMQKFTSDD